MPIKYIYNIGNQISLPILYFIKDILSIIRDISYFINDVIKATYDFLKNIMRSIVN